MKPSGLVFATMLEAQPFIEALDLEQKMTTPFPVYSDDSKVLIISGIGKTNAAIATTCLITHFTPKAVYNLGAAGALDQELKLCDTFCVNHITEPDRPDTETAIPHTHTPQCLPNFTPSALITCDRPIISDTERQKLSEIAPMTDMEAAAVAQTCSLFNTPCHVIKFISDTHAHHKIYENIISCRQTFCDTVLAACTAGRPMPGRQ